MTDADDEGLQERLSPVLTINGPYSPGYFYMVPDKAGNYVLYAAYEDQAKEIAELRKEKDEDARRIEDATAVCDSYAEENQRLSDRAEKAEAALAEALKVIAGLRQHSCIGDIPDADKFPDDIAAESAACAVLAKHGGRSDG